MGLSQPIPFKETKDGKKYLTELQLIENPEIRVFVERFRRIFKHDPQASTYWLITPKGCDE
jgi:hypothetical protein